MYSSIIFKYIQFNTRPDLTDIIDFIIDIVVLFKIKEIVTTQVPPVIDRES